MAAAIETSTIALICVAVLAWLACAFYAAGTARNNGESYNLWLIIGVLTGPLGLVFALVYFRLTGERYRRRRYAAEEKSDIAAVTRCPNCNQVIPVTFERCQFCGCPLDRRKRR